MKLNYDCIRKILLYVEANSGYEPNTTIYKIIQPREISKALRGNDFNDEEITYAIQLLFEEGYFNINRTPVYGPNNTLFNIDITSLSLRGNELLNNIRNDTAWNAVKERCKKVGVGSVKAISTITGALGTAMLTDPNALQNFIDGTKNMLNIIH
nr:DUF2513 domain-containing protein [Clostridium sp. Marseille-P7770]